jgi:hypothetical protein
MSGYIGTQPVPQATQTRDSFTATSGQTSFATGGYTPNFLDVYLNGVKLAAADYTATNGSDVILASGASVNDVVDIVAYGTFELADHYTRTASDARYVEVAGDTMTGNLNVTGTVTSDGLSLDNAQYISFKNSSNASTRALGINGANTFYVGGIDADIGDILFVDGGTTRASFANGGDISFYNSAGDAAKFFWDASEENLGIGGASTFTSGTNIEVTDSNVARLGFTNTSTNGSQWAWYSGTSGQAALYDYDNSAQRMTIDSSGNVLVGRTSSSGVDTDGHVLFENGVSYQSNTDNGVQFINRNGTNDGALTTFYKNGSTVGSIGTLSGDLTIGTGDTGLGFLDGGNFIQPHNTTTNAVRDAAIDLGTTSGRFKDLYLSGDVKLGDAKDLSWGGDYANGAPTIAASNNFIAFYPEGNVSAEAMRIDSSGNLLAGKTSPAGVSTNGVEIRKDGIVIATKASGISGYFGRTSSNGEIVRFYRDSTIVGSIGAVGTQSYIHGGGTDVGIYFGSNNLYPYRQAGLNDATIDLGQGSKRFKDLYLSGGVYLGGTGSANKLDDYEEGTWSPSVEFASVGSTATTASSVYTTGGYVKIGKAVTIELNISGIVFGNGTGNVKLTGLPFTPSGVPAVPGKATASSGHLVSANTASGYLTILKFYGVSTYNLMWATGTGTSFSHITNVNAAAIAPDSINGSFTYYTNS